MTVASSPASTATTAPPPVFGETTSSFNNGAATPSSVTWGPFTASTDIEYSIPLNTAIPGNISASFPGGLGSTIGFVFGDGNGGAGDAEGMSYVLATAPSPTPMNDIDLFGSYDTNANAASRTKDVSTAAGFTTTRANRAAGGPAGAADVALQVTHTNPPGTAFGISMVAHRFATPINISGHSTIKLDAIGDGALSSSNENLFVGLLDADGSYWAVGAGAPGFVTWGTYDFGPTSGWFEQVAGGTAGLDTTKIVEWRLGIQENGGAVGSTSTISYDNFRAVSAAGISDWQLLN